MNTNDIGATEITAAFGATMSVGTAIFLMMQIIKAFVPQLSGAAAEVAVIVTSIAAMTLALVGVHADWMRTDTWLALVVGTLSSTVIARGVFAQLFKDKT